MVAKNETAKEAAKPRRRTRSAKVAKIEQPALAEPLSNDQIVEMMTLVRGANSVELKLSVPLPGQRATVKSIGFDPVEAEPRQAYFFDTPDLALNRAGVVVRARRVQGGGADTVIKLRPVDPSTIDPELYRSAAFKVELDAMPGGYVCSASYKGVCTGKEVLDVAAGAISLRKIFSREQRTFYDAHAPAGITMDKLVILGPVFLLRVKHQPKDFDRRIIVELWLYPDGARVMEISTKCLPQEAFQVVAEFKHYLTQRGILLVADQSAKTKTALEYFSAHRDEEQPAG